MLNLPPESKPIDPKDILPGDTVCVHQINATNGCHVHFTGIVSGVEDKGQFYTFYFGDGSNTHSYVVYKSRNDYSAIWDTTIYLLSRPPQWKPITLQDLRTIPLGSVLELGHAAWASLPLDKFVRGRLISREESLRKGFSYALKDDKNQIWHFSDESIEEDLCKVQLPI